MPFSLDRFTIHYAKKKNSERTNVKKQAFFLLFWLQSSNHIKVSVY